MSSIGSRMSERLRPPRDLSYRIPGDDVHHRARSPQRSRSRSRSSSRPRTDTPMQHKSMAVAPPRAPVPFDISEEREEEEQDKAEEEEKEEEERNNGHTPSLRSRRTWAQSKIQAERPQEEREGEDEDEDEENEEEVRAEGTPKRLRTRSSRHRPSPSPLRDVLDSVSSAASKVASQLSSALSSVSERSSDDQHESATGDEEQEGGGEEEKTRDIAEELEIRLSPPVLLSSSEGQEEDQILASPRLARETQETAFSSSTSVPWVLPLMCVLMIVLSLLGRVFIPHLLDASLSPSPSEAMLEARLPLLLEDRQAIIDSLAARLSSSNESQSLTEGNQPQKELLSILHRAQTDFESSLNDFQSQLSILEKREDVQEEAVKTLSSEFHERVEAMSAKISDALQSVITEQLAAVLKSERKDNGEKLEALRREMQDWARVEIAAAQERSVSSSSPSSSSVTDALLQSSLEELRGRFEQQIDSQLSSLHEKISQQIGSLSNDFASKAQLSELETNLREALEKVSEKQVEQRKTELDQIENRVSERLKASTAAIEKSSAASQKEALEDALKSLRKELDQRFTTLQNVEHKSEKEISAASLGSLEKALAELRALIQAKERDLSDLSQHVDEIASSSSSSVSSSSASPELLEKVGKLEALIAEHKNAITALEEAASSSSSSALLLEDLHRHVQSLYEALAPKIGDHIASELDLALEKFAADRTNLVDHALGTSGGEILASSATYQVPLENSNAWLNLLVQAYAPHHGPEEIITDRMSVGSCWPMKGSSGGALIQLREAVAVTALTVQHVAAAITPDLSTMPRSVRLSGVPSSLVQSVKHALNHQESLNLDGLVPLGSFTYDSKGRQVQKWPITAGPSEVFRNVLFSVDSNYGSRNYTCIYRVRVHGTHQK